MTYNQYEGFVNAGMVGKMSRRGGGGGVVPQPTSNLQLGVYGTAWKGTM